MEMTPTLILNLALLIVPPVALVLVFRQWLALPLCWCSGNGWPGTSAGRLP